MQDIVSKYLHQLQQRAVASGIQLSLPEELPRQLSGSLRKKDGARQLRRVVQEQVEGPLAVFLLKTGKKPSKIRGYWENGAIQFQI